MRLLLIAPLVTASEFVVSLPRTHDKAELGRVRLYLSTRCGAADPPPRAQCSDSQDTAQAFGVDTPAAGLLPGGSVQITQSTRGYPRHSLDDVPSGTYCVQAELFPYRHYMRGDGANLTLPISCVSDAGGDGAYGSPPGTLYSDVATVTLVDEASRKQTAPTTTLALTHEVPKAVSPGCSGKGHDTDYIKTLRTPSALLSQFWGTPISLEACVLLPWGFHEHPKARYPLVIAHGHYSAVFTPGGRFDDTPPSAWPANLSGYALVDQQYAYYLYQNWTSPSGPFHGARVLVITINHPVPFFDDSYAVDSANVGPYGSAILHELLPAIESKYRGIGQGWARGVFGGSTGGWESFASQVLYPDEFNYAVAACPDPIGFRSYTTIDLYSARNAYYYNAPFKRTARPGERDHYSGTSVIPGTSTPTYGNPKGQTTATVEEMNRREMVLGEKSRSCGQWDIWEAVFGPKGADGYPARIWCKGDEAGHEGCEYGAINTTVAAYWKEHFDLTERIKTQWSKGLGEKLSGKLHVYVGGSDTFFLTDAVMDLQDWVNKAGASLDPPFGGTITIGAHGGRGYEHCFNGYLPDGTVAPNAITRELYVTKFVPRMAKRFAATAPKGANMEWRSY